MTEIIRFCLLFDWLLFAYACFVWVAVNNVVDNVRLTGNFNWYVFHLFFHDMHILNGLMRLGHQEPTVDYDATFNLMDIAFE